MKDYYIRIPNFYSFNYFEGDKVMEIILDFRDPVLYLTPTLIKKWQEPYEQLEISYEDKVRMLNNIKECVLQKSGWMKEVIIELPEKT